jgi:hypothetical protein
MSVPVYCAWQLKRNTGPLGPTTKQSESQYPLKSVIILFHKELARLNSGRTRSCMTTILTRGYRKDLMKEPIPTYAFKQWSNAQLYDHYFNARVIEKI